MYLNWGSLHNKNVTRCRKPALKRDVRRGPKCPMGALICGPSTCPSTTDWLEPPAQEWRPSAHYLPACTQLTAWILNVGKHNFLTLLQLNPSTPAWRKLNSLFPVPQASCPLLLQAASPFPLPKVLPRSHLSDLQLFCSHQLLQAKESASDGKAIQSSH